MKPLKSIFNNPKAVTAVSLILAITIGIFWYIKINKDRSFVVESNGNTATSTGNSSSTQNLSLGFLAGGRIKTVSVKAGDQVKKDQVLATLDAGSASGAVTQAGAAYKSAQANYNKVTNGATGPTIDVAKAAVNTAKINLEQVTNQQETLVTNARRKLYSDSLIAQPDSTAIVDNPIITGTFNGAEPGDYYLFFDNFNFNYIRFGGIERGTADFSQFSKPLGTLGLQITFPNGSKSHTQNDSWIIHIPNKDGGNYTANLNAYQLALQTKEQMVASAQTTLDQANANLASTISSARPEDVAAAQAQMQNAAGAFQIAEAAYKNTIITAPADGTVISVAITPGQIAVPNAPAIEFTGSTNPSK
ncbi:TPA: hypothetical protein DCQ44_02055 [Candidatus Taylorbacteria bacterium]|nr:hypothetical protein [Candidatus Taylorbacteria bacterium]